MRAKRGPMSKDNDTIPNIVGSSDDQNAILPSPRCILRMLFSVTLVNSKNMAGSGSAKPQVLQL